MSALPPRSTLRTGFSASKLLPVIGLSAVVGVYCGYEPSKQAPSFQEHVAARQQKATISVGCDATTKQADLIAAINTANNETTNPGPDVIELADGCTYSFMSPDNYWYGPNALPPITSTITIRPTASGKNVVLERASAATTNFRLLYVAAAELPPKLPGNLTLLQVTLRGGRAKGGDSAAGFHTGGGGLGAGGAVFSHGSLSVIQATLEGNQALGGNSGNTSTSMASGGGGMGGNSGLASATLASGGGGFRDATAENGGHGVGNTEGGLSTGVGGTSATGSENGGDAVVGLGGNGGAFVFTTEMLPMAVRVATPCSS